jgi:hypothetical protein
LELREVVSKATRRFSISMELGESLLMADTVARLAGPGQGPLFDTPGPRR